MPAAVIAGLVPFACNARWPGALFNEDALGANPLVIRIAELEEGTISS